MPRSLVLLAIIAVTIVVYLVLHCGADDSGEVSVTHGAEAQFHPSAEHESRFFARVLHAVHNDTSERYFMGIDGPKRTRSIIIGMIFGLVGLILLGLFFLCLRDWIEIHYGVGQVTDPELALAPPSVSSPPSRGLELTAIEALSAIPYPPHRLGDEVPDSMCSICLEDFSIGMEITVLPCHHFFHPACIKAALLLRPTCPYCNQTVTVAEI